ncbi:MAG: hypothetical protein QXL15_00785 [Candidatus Korarchaeota archaeon]
MKMERLDLTKYPKSVRRTYIAILNGSKTTTEIENTTLLSQRTVRYAIKVLMKIGLVRRIFNLQDMRQSMYVPAKRIEIS